MQVLMRQISLLTWREGRLALFSCFTEEKNKKGKFQYSSFFDEDQKWYPLLECLFLQWGAIVQTKTYPSCCLAERRADLFASELTCWHCCWQSGYPPAPGAPYSRCTRPRTLSQSGQTVRTAWPSRLEEAKKKACAVPGQVCSLLEIFVFDFVITLSLTFCWVMAPFW